MADVQGLIADPRFQKLEPDQQREVLGRIDDRFSNLTDDQLTEFKSKAAPKELPLTDKARNFMLHGSMASLSPDDHSRSAASERGETFEFPRWLEVASSVLALGEGAVSLYKNGPALLAAAKAFKQGATPKLATKLGNLYEEVSEAMKMAKDPNYARLVKSGEGFSPKGTGTKYTPGGAEPKYGPANPPKVSQGPPETKVAPESPRKGTGTRYTPGGVESQYGPARPPNPKGSKVGAKAASPDLSTPAIKAKLPPSDDDVVELPSSGYPKRAPRTDPIAQKRSEEIASLNRHADVLPLAQQTVKQGVTSKQLLAMNPAQKAAFMAKLGLQGRSDATWRTYLGHVLRLEKVAK